MRPEHRSEARPARPRKWRRRRRSDQDRDPTTRWCPERPSSTERVGHRIVDRFPVPRPVLIGGTTKHVGDLGAPPPTVAAHRTQLSHLTARDRHRDRLTGLGLPNQLTGLLTQLPQTRCRHEPKASTCATHAAARRRGSECTTVDSTLLDDARSARSGVWDAVLVDEALSALLARHRAAEVDASHAAYDEHPLEEPDEWGDLASFRQAAATS